MECYRSWSRSRLRRRFGLSGLVGSGGGLSPPEPLAAFPPLPPAPLPPAARVKSSRRDGSGSGTAGDGVSSSATRDPWWFFALKAASRRPRGFSSSVNAGMRLPPLRARDRTRCSLCTAVSSDCSSRAST